MFAHFAQQAVGGNFEDGDIVGAAAVGGIKVAAIGRDFNGGAAFIALAGRQNIGGYHRLFVHQRVVFKMEHGDIARPFVEHIHKALILAEHQMARPLALAQTVNARICLQRLHRAGIKAVLVDAVVTQIGNQHQIVARPEHGGVGMRLAAEVGQGERLARRADAALRFEIIKRNIAAAVVGHGQVAAAVVHGHIAGGAAVYRLAVDKA